MAKGIDLSPFLGTGDDSDEVIEEIQSGWYRVTVVEASTEAVVSQDGNSEGLPFLLRIETEEGGFQGERIRHRFTRATADGIEDERYEQRTLRMWRGDFRAFLTACFPKGFKPGDVDLAATEGVELYAYVQPARKPFQGERRPEVVPRRWAATLPEGAVEGPAA